MFDLIAPRYDLLNRLMSLGLDERWRRRAVEALALDGVESPAVLDLATGTGDVAIAVARRWRSAAVVGVDPSASMLEVAAGKLARRGLGGRVLLERGDAERLRFGDHRFDGATMAFGIRNVPRREVALAELARVVRPGGRVAILELAEPRSALARFQVHRVVPWIGARLSGQREYGYLARSIAAFPPAEEFAATMGAAGLRVLEVRPMTFGVVTLFVATPR